MRGGVSGNISSTIGLLQLPLVVLLLWLLAIAIGWWTIAVFVGLSLLVGMAVNRSNLGAWVNLQPIVGMAMIALALAACAIYYFGR